MVKFALPLLQWRCRFSNQNWRSFCCMLQISYYKRWYKSLASMIMFTSFPHPHTSTKFLLGPMYVGHHLLRNQLLLPALLWGICGPPFLDTGFKPPCTRGHDSKSWFPNLFSKDIPTVLRHPFLRSLGIDNIKIVVPIIAGAKSTNPCPSGCCEERS